MVWIVFGVMITLVAINVPIGFALALTTIILVLATSTTPLTVVPLKLFEGSSSFPLLAIPLFILAGGLMNFTGISRRLINLASALVGFIRGGLAMANIVASMFFAEISGSAVADAAALGTIIIPAMKLKGYAPRFAAACVSSAASLAIIIPPSIPMILYAVMAESSVVQLFLAGVVPGVIGGGLMMFLSYHFARKRNYPVEEAFTLRNVSKAFKEAAWALILPAIILGGIFGGVVTATEGAGLAVVAAFLIGTFIYREMNFRHLKRVLIESCIQTAVVMVIVAASVLLAWYLTNERIPQHFAEAILATASNRYMVLVFLNIFFLIAGMFLHSAAAIILIVPIVMPLVRQLGIDPTHFGIIVTLNLAIGQQTPPVASVLLTTCSIAGLPMAEVMKDNIYFIGVLLIVLTLVTYVPIVPMFLVHVFYG